MARVLQVGDFLVHAVDDLEVGVDALQMMCPPPPDDDIDHFSKKLKMKSKKIQETNQSKITMRGLLKKNSIPG